MQGNSIVEIAGYPRYKLEIAGYPRHCFDNPGYNQMQRSTILEAPPKTRDQGPKRNLCFLSLDYTEAARSLGLPRVFKNTVGACIDIRLIMAWGMKPNSMRQLYAMNWPYGQRP